MNEVVLMQVDHAKAMDWIRRNWTKPTECPICGSDNWGIGDQIVEIRSSKSGGLAYPQFFVYCQKCAYTIFFNAIIAGLAGVTPGANPQDELPRYDAGDK